MHPIIKTQIFTNLPYIKPLLVLPDLIVRFLLVIPARRFTNSSTGRLAPFPFASLVVLLVTTIPVISSLSITDATIS